MLHTCQVVGDQLTVVVLASGPIRSKRPTREGFTSPPPGYASVREGLANNPSADSARPDSARWSGARRAADLRAVRQDRDVDEERGDIAVAATADHGGATATALWRRFPLSPRLEIVRTTDAGSVADWDDHPRRKVVLMVLCRESQTGGLSPCLGSGRGRRYARQGSSQPAAPADVAEPTDGDGCWQRARCGKTIAIVCWRGAQCRLLIASGGGSRAERWIRCMGGVRR